MPNWRANACAVSGTTSQQATSSQTPRRSSSLYPGACDTSEMRPQPMMPIWALPFLGMVGVVRPSIEDSDGAVRWVDADDIAGADGGDRVGLEAVQERDAG